jgi:hypothetical protein
MTNEVLSHVIACRIAGETWKVIEENFTSAKRARTIISRIALATTEKGDFSITEYVSKMHVLGDELATAGKPINDDELILYIFASLDYEYNSVATTLLAKEVLTIDDDYSQPLHYEQRLTLQTSGEHYSMVANCGYGTTHGRGGPRGGGLLQSVSQGIGRGAACFSPGRGNFNNHQDNRPIC